MAAWPMAVESMEVGLRKVVDTAAAAVDPSEPVGTAESVAEQAAVGE